MVQENLIVYIKNQLHNGYDTHLIKNTLLKSGYSESDIDEAVKIIYSGNDIHSPYLKTEHHRNFHGFLILLALIIIVSAGFFAYYNMFTEKSIELKISKIDINLFIVTKEVIPGNDLIFQESLVNSGSMGDFNVLITNSVLDGDGNLIVSNKKNVVVSDKISDEFSLNIDKDLKSGTYVLKSTIIYDDKESSVQKIFSVKKADASSIQGNCFDGIKNQNEQKIDCGGICKPCSEDGFCPRNCDDYNPCTKDYCSSETNFICMHTILAPCCGNKICELNEDASCKNDCSQLQSFNDPYANLLISERIDRIVELSSSDVNKAGEMCSALSPIESKDNCFYKVSLNIESVKACDNIESSNIKDKCFSKISQIKLDPSICENIISDQRKDSCFMGFIISSEPANRNYSVCDKLFDDYLQRSCFQLKKLSEVKTPAEV